MEDIWRVASVSSLKESLEELKLYPWLLRERTIEDLAERYNLPRLSFEGYILSHKKDNQKGDRKEVSKKKWIVQ